MKLEELFSCQGELGECARAFVKAAAKFLEVLSANNIDLDFHEAEDTTNVIDYDSPASASYKKSYKPITTSEIVKANREISEAISGEKWTEGFLACVQLMLLVK